MKKIIFALLIAFTIWSCSLGDDTGAQFLVGPVQDVEMASNYKVDSTSKITIHYKRVSDCHIFNGLYYGISGNTRTVAIKFVRVEGTNCQPDDESVYEVPLYFKPMMAGTYTFKFFTGRDSEGNELYTEETALVGQ
ncbi:MAG TPA: hypothetical protein VK623_07240 [Flavobacterium sp.]|nr:hypothetical protein [Flavobacterium sp.]